MNNPSIVLVSNKHPESLAPIVSELEGFSRECKLIYTCLNSSAAVNRNYGLSQVKDNEMVIMIDDDIRGFYTNWYQDLILPLQDSSIAYVSARLMTRDNKPGVCMDLDGSDLTTPIIDVAGIPTSCVAFRKTSLRFNEAYLGSGFEDTQFSWEMKKLGRIVVTNSCKIFHLNERKNQDGVYWRHNRIIFDEWVKNNKGVFNG